MKVVVHLHHGLYFSRGMFPVAFAQSCIDALNSKNGVLSQKPDTSSSLKFLCLQVFQSCMSIRRGKCLKPPHTHSCHAKIPFCKGPSKFSLRCSPKVKNFQVLCSFDTVFLFKYDFLENILCISFTSLGRHPALSGQSPPVIVLAVRGAIL